MTHKVKLSIVTSMYQSQDFIPEFYKRVVASTKELTEDFEIILVNDGCPGSSLKVAKEIATTDRRVWAVELSRNFGHHRALMTGMELARGEKVFLIDCDLEEPPEDIQRFWVEMDKSGADVIYGVQANRKGGWLEKVSGQLFYLIFNFMSEHAVPKNLATVRLMKRRYVESLVQFKDREIFLGGLFAIAGFHQVAVAVEKGDRGSSSYSFRKKMALMLSALTSFSSRPLVYISLAGFGITALATLAAAAVIVARLTSDFVISGWTSLIVSLWLLGGLQLFCIGIVGIYVAKIFNESKRRPYTIVREIYGAEREAVRELTF